MQVYQLSGIGKCRLEELIEERERNIKARLSHINQKKPVKISYWKNVKSIMSSIFHFRVSSE